MVSLVGGVILLAPLVALAAICVHMVRRVPKPADIVWLAGHIPGSHQESDFYSAYLQRQLRFRAIGGLAGALVAVVLATRYFGMPLIRIGTFDLPFTDALWMGIAGVVVGGLAAESYRVKLPSGPRAAGLEPRPDLVPRGVQWMARALFAACLVLALIGLAAGDGSAALIFTAMAAVPVVLAELTSWAIAGRARPLLEAPVMDADLAVRRFAGRATVWLELSVALLALPRVLPEAPAATAWEFWRAVISWACLVAAIVAFLRSKVRAPRAWRTEFEASRLP
ncbi:MAG: hypothetical protein LBH68_04315 [Bifidobacteriaceae bacterium]|jgi:hypothetical protein|nr:hypothetical protein [Bifidobacteriaceae bacterium]